MFRRYSKFIRMNGSPFLSIAWEAGGGLCQAQSDGASCILCRVALRWLVGVISTCPPSLSGNLWKRLTFRRTFRKHWKHILSVENETFRQLSMRSTKHALIGLPEMTGWRPKSTMQLHLQTEDLCHLRHGWTLRFLKTSQDHLRCSDGSLVRCAGLSAVLLSNPGI